MQSSDNSWQMLAAIVTPIEMTRRVLVNVKMKASLYTWLTTLQLLNRSI